MGRTEEILKSPRKRKQFYVRLCIIFVLGLGALWFALAEANKTLNSPVPLPLVLFAFRIHRQRCPDRSCGKKVVGEISRQAAQQLIAPRRAPASASLRLPRAGAFDVSIISIGFSITRQTHLEPYAHNTIFRSGRSAQLLRRRLFQQSMGAHREARTHARGRPTYGRTQPGINLSLAEPIRLHATESLHRVLASFANSVFTWSFR